MHILIVYHSDYGSTEKMAQAIAAGASANQPDCHVSIKQAADTALNDLQQADVIFFGSPVHMGSMAWQVKDRKS
ncbi:MAG: flavodoxin domain-containing protein, partial [Mariprofundaceae bacterium]|nr:flavodoxin domain-containing protein [Mariprofundaceae bacterium]